MYNIIFHQFSIIDIILTFAIGYAIGNWLTVRAVWKEEMNKRRPISNLGNKRIKKRR